MKVLVKNLIDEGALKTPEIIGAFYNIDRRDFVPEEYTKDAYRDSPLPIGYGQTISQPYTVAFMLELLAPKGGNKIMEIGSGSGWQTALLAHIVSEDKINKNGKVHAIELLPELMVFGRKNVAKYDFVKDKIAEFHCFNVAGGMPDNAPYDRIISAASAREIPLAWKEQLKTGGRMVAPVGNSIFLIEKKSENEFKEKEYPGFAFVPFVH
ncbi:TPA: protein-L-isoaspartate O-methyltransferase [Patescibacteria group bacterium]|nr:MAG: L-isoaspartyl protein carboxyl methyltransferase [Parcubacteria group bacterium GW2011_GWF2_40_10]KKR46989.1 MAG: L-isoaspartyl protein carboxyl methyltransferase [Parcubacteria group bacterium GW2011_GWA2_40_143]KKR59186.1 MAG: L-isoaspartyl protein carboxyl methyltransferase [Parcubacteria group bacterium GW2011_GWC2_40_31]KKR74873.1 MAG: L-isoaspartyl protein carboxyl methyltransferase [Parcubacteria group bacterium GW2011_GWB2_40_8]KKR76188.1 MAG: L-isoaspartyl protein carboxyl meth